MRTAVLCSKQFQAPVLTASELYTLEKLLAKPLRDYTLVVGDESVDLVVVQEAWESGMESVFPIPFP